MNTLNLKLEKQDYNPGEKVKGTIELAIDSDVEIRSIMPDPFISYCYNVFVL